MIYHKTTCQLYNKTRLRSQIYRVPLQCFKLHLKVLVFVRHQVPRALDELRQTATKGIWTPLLPEKFPSNRQQSKMTVFLTDLKGDNLHFMVLYSRAKHTGFSRAWFYVTFSFHKARLQKSRQAISCYFVFSPLRSYLHSILTMLFSKMGVHVVNTFPSDHKIF